MAGTKLEPKPSTEIPAATKPIHSTCPLAPLLLLSLMSLLLLSEPVPSNVTSWSFILSFLWPSAKTRPRKKKKSAA